MGDYKLCCTVVGHEKDVRGVCTALNPDGGFISASRDVTTRVWAPNEADSGFSEVHRMTGHENFVSCICILPPSDNFPNGVIVTGSNDKNIHGYTLESTTPVFKLTGHTNTVCSLAAGKFGTLLSGSWDKTAKVWFNQKCVMTLEGHEAAVWCVAIIPEGGLMLTGSADKTIKMWKAGRCEKTFKGHNDCVRGLVVLNSAEFLSCANDATIKRWLTADGSCTHTYHGHDNYIYSLAVMPNGEDFVSSGEDRTLRIWKNGTCAQIITHPAQSVWTTCVLGNGDIVTGSSDGMVRVFSNHPSRQANAEEQKAYEDQLASSEIPQQIGDIKTDQLLGPEALFNPGKRDGQTLMVKDGTNITAHTWSASEGKWIAVGNVVGGVGGNKKLYNGKEYDFVFDVDIQEDKPPLKLPYNLTDDPWMAAHNFLADNDISQMYLDQVAKFIMQQTKGLQPDVAPVPTNVISDPFTGGSRYVPQGGYQAPAPRPPPTFTSTGADPFTGASSYQPSSATSSSQSNPFFPKTTYLSFDQANIDAIIGKMKEFNSKVSAEVQVDEESLSRLSCVISESNDISSPQLDVITTVLKWPNDLILPSLDILRLAIRNKQANEYFYKDANFLTTLLGQLVSEQKPNNQMLLLRSLVNSFKHSSGEQSLVGARESVIASVLSLTGISNKNVQIAVGSLLLNYSIVSVNTKHIELKTLCLQAIKQLQDIITDPEAHFRILVALGTLINGDQECQALAQSLDLALYPQKLLSVSDPPKVAQCAKLLLGILS